MNEKIDIRSLTLFELEERLKGMNEPRYRALQIFHWLHKRDVLSFDEMSDISSQLKGKLGDNFWLNYINIEKRLESSLQFTVKYLYRLFDGEYVEAVLMKYEHGYSACISTQAGCRMGCAFCATGMGGFSRNLTSGEMILQLKGMEKDNGIRISNVVLMGMGEPLDNFEHVMRFLELVSCDEGMNIGMRHISVSTCGLVDKILDLITTKPQFTLSVSLHAPNDSIRDKLMPVNRKWNVSELLDACGKYACATGRRISFEYAMIDGVNDTEECAGELARKLKGMLCHVNLIPVNDVKGSAYGKSNRGKIELFIKILKKSGITATVRRSLGSDIDAACGQLKRSR